MIGIKKHGNRSKHSMHLQSPTGNVCYIMLAAVRNCCIKQVRIRHRRSSASKTTTAASLGQAVRNAATVETLSLEASPDLLCMNLMCEKVGDPCICRLSVVLEKLHQLEGLNLSGNKLISLPDSIGQLQRLRYLDLSNNKLHTLPKSIQYLKQLEVNMLLIV